MCLSVKSHLTSGASVRPENIYCHVLGGQQRSNKTFVGFSLKLLCCRDSAFIAEIQPPLKAIRTVDHFPAESACAFSIYHMVGPKRSFLVVSCHWSFLQNKVCPQWHMNSWRQGFCTLVHSFHLRQFIFL